MGFVLKTNCTGVLASLRMLLSWGICSGAMSCSAPDRAYHRQCFAGITRRKDVCFCSCVLFRPHTPEGKLEEGFFALFSLGQLFVILEARTCRRMKVSPSQCYVIPSRQSRIRHGCNEGSDDARFSGVVIEIDAASQ
jgi:hypothetical protein